MQRLYDQGDIVLSSTGRTLRRKRWLKDTHGKAVVDLWDDVFRVSPTAKERVDFPTQKSLSLLNRIIETSSNEGDVVADFFLGSGTTVVAAERLRRRWIGADLGRFSVQTTRKRMLDATGCRPFEILNVGHYERSQWQGADVGERIGEYYDFIIQLYGATRLDGFNHLHGIKGDRMVHVGATDAPVTADELELAISECAEGSTLALDVLGWEWEMGLNPSRKDELAHFYEVDVHLLNIPREVMDQKAVEAGDIHFFELSVVELEQAQDDRGLVVEITNFLPAVDHYMAEKVGDAISRWSDWIDYWSIDFDYNGETFINSWQSYRTRQDRSLSLTSDPHPLRHAGQEDDRRQSDRHLRQRHHARTDGRSGVGMPSARLMQAYQIPAQQRQSKAALVPAIRRAVHTWRSRGYDGATNTSKALLRHWFETDHEIGGQEWLYYYCQREGDRDDHLSARGVQGDAAVHAGAGVRH